MNVIDLTSDDSHNMMDIDSSAPPAPVITLKPHQLKAVAQLTNAFVPSFLLADQVGSGKTLTSLATGERLLNTGIITSVVVVCPKSVIGHWKKEMRRLPVANATLYTFFTHAGMHSRLKTIEEQQRLLRGAMFIIDEAHELRRIIKDRFGNFIDIGARAKVAIQCAAIATKVMLLTATPLYNNEEDTLNLTSLMYAQQGTAMATAAGDTEQMKRLLMGRVSIHSPPPENYPKVTLHDVVLTMSSSYYAAYKVIEDLTFQKAAKRREASSSSSASAAPVVPASPEFLVQKFGNIDYAVFYNTLRRSANLDKLNDAVGSPKISWIKDFIKQHRTQKLFICSQFLAAGNDQLIRFLQEHHIQYRYIKGSMKKSERTEAVDAFNSGEVTVLLASKSGQISIDLKLCDHVILMESFWNDSSKQQAIGRAARCFSHAEGAEVHVWSLILDKPPTVAATSLPSVDRFLRTMMEKKAVKTKEFREKVLIPCAI